MIARERALAVRRDGAYGIGMKTLMAFILALLATAPAVAEEPNEKLLRQVTGGKEQLCRVDAELAKVAARSRDAGMPAYKVRQSLRRSAERSEQPRKLADAELQREEAIVDFVYANPRLAADDAARSTYRSCLQRAAAEMRALVAPP